MDQWDMACLCSIDYEELEHILGKRYKKIDIVTMAQVSAAIDALYKSWEDFILGTKNNVYQSEQWIFKKNKRTLNTSENERYAINHRRDII